MEIIWCSDHKGDNWKSTAGSLFHFIKLETDGFGKGLICDSPHPQLFFFLKDWELTTSLYSSELATWLNALISFVSE
jgi:hypothetical protein